MRRPSKNIYRKLLYLHVFGFNSLDDYNVRDDNNRKTRREIGDKKVR